MLVVPCKWRELLPPEAQERFDDVNEQRVLGASSHIRIIGDIFLSIAENGADDPLPLLRGIADHFIATRGESSQAITNAIGLMLRNVHGSSRAELAQSIRKGVECYRTEAAKDLEKIRSLLWTVLEGKRTLLLYDYSSTVAAISALTAAGPMSHRCSALGTASMSFRTVRCINIFRRAMPPSSAPRRTIRTEHALTRSARS